MVHYFCSSSLSADFWINQQKRGGGGGGGGDD